MALLEQSGNPDKLLKGTDFTAQGDTKTLNDDLALVVGCATKAEQFIENKQYSLLWRDADILFQSPRPLSVFENS